MSNQKKDDEYWMNVINTCRTSGLSDSQWCRNNGIKPSTFYYHVKCLREKACQIPISMGPGTPQKQEVVQIFENGIEPVQKSEPCIHTAMEGTEMTSSSTAIRLDFHGVHLEITNAASSSVIADTLKVLQFLC